MKLAGQPTARNPRHVVLTGTLLALFITSCVGSHGNLRSAGIDEGGRIEAILINGGHKAKENGAAHLEHLRRLLTHLDRSEMPRAQVTVFASDGDDPTPDLALHEGNGADDWLLEGTRFSALLTARSKLINSTLDQMPLLPARKAALRTWFQLRGKGLRAGDTLLIYVTDHGTKGAIQLWGENLKVDDLKRMLSTLDPGIRVLTIMSQCYAGSFAAISLDDATSGDTCGYFSTLANRKAYGCYRHVPEDPDGHAFRLMQALEGTGDLRHAHRQLRWTDRTPDIPVSTSELYASDILAQYASSQNEQPDATAWSLVGAETQREIRELLSSFGLSLGPAPRWLAGPRAKLRLQRQRLRGLHKGWKQRQRALVRRLADQALREHPSLRPHRFHTSDGASIEDLEKVLGVMRDLKDRQPTEKQTLESAHAQLELTRTLRYRVEVRLSAIDRAQSLLHARAGERLALKESAEAATLTRLKQCEARRLGNAGDAPHDRSWEPEPMEDVVVDDNIIATMVAPSTAPPPTSRRGKQTHSRVGTEAPSPSGLDYSHGAATAPDQAVLYVFWATWCKPCKRAFPAVRAYADEKGVALVAVTRETRGRVDSFLASWTQWAPGTIAHDPKGLVSRAFDVHALPTFVLVGADGLIKAHRRGMPGDGNLRLP